MRQWDRARAGSGATQKLQRRRCVFRPDVAGMLSYRHAFHAGAAADVLKHAVWAFVLRYMTRKAAPIYALDTHAGAGLYELASPMALKTGEHRRGIDRLRGLPAPWPDLLEPWREVLAAVRAMHGPTSYPGSPEVARQLLRPGDRLELAELHPTDYRLLAAPCGGGPRRRVTRSDGLALLVERLPPPERRAAVLIDPSYELKDEYGAVVAALAKAHRRSATAVLLLWYPVIDRDHAREFLHRLAQAPIRRQFRIELATRPDGSAPGLTASGLIVVNPPWLLPAAAEAALPWLAARLATSGGWTAEWLTPP